MNDLFTINQAGASYKFYPKESNLVSFSHTNFSKLTFLNICMTVSVSVSKCARICECMRVYDSLRECARAARVCVCVHIECVCANLIHMLEFKFVAMVTWNFLTVNK